MEVKPAPTDLAEKIVTFLEDHDPAFGYVEGLAGQENREQWIDTITEQLSYGLADDRISHLRKLAENSPEAKNEADAIIHEIQSRIIMDMDSIGYEPCERDEGFLFWKPKDDVGEENSFGMDGWDAVTDFVMGVHTLMENYTVQELQARADGDYSKIEYGEFSDLEVQTALNNLNMRARDQQETSHSNDKSEASPAQKDQEKRPTEELSRKLMEGVSNVMNSDRFKAWLDTSSKFFTNNFSFNNAILVFSQKPDASYCMGYESWKEYGRNVRKGAEGADIFMPLFAYEKQEGDFFRFMKGRLLNQLKDSSSDTASYRLGSKMEFTLNRAGVWGLRMNGKEQTLFGNETQVKRFIQNNVLNKVPVRYIVGRVFDVKDTVTPQFLWVRKGFTKDEMVRDKNGKAVKNDRGEYKIRNTPERIARFTPELGSKIIEQDPVKMGTLLEVLKSVSERNAVPVNEVQKSDDKVLNGGAKGYFSRKDKSITLDEGLSPTEKVSTLLHEMGHADLHGDLDRIQRIMGEKVPTEMREVQAESVAYAVASQFGITTDTSSFSYIAGWSKGTQIQDLAKSLDVIFQESRKLTNEISSELRSRGLNLDLSDIANPALSEEEKKDIAATYMSKVIAKEEKDRDILTELPKTAAQYKESRDILDSLAQQMKEVKGQLTSISEIKDLCDQLMMSTDRTQQDAIIGKLEAGMNRISSEDQKIEMLSEGFMEQVKEQNRRFDKFIRNPEKSIAELKKTFPDRFEGLSSLQLDYLAKSDYIRTKVAPLLIADPTGQRFVEKATERADAVGRIAAKNGAFVEILHCEQWTKSPLIENGALAHPSIANCIIKNGEAEIQKLRKAAESKEDYFPYTKCKLTVFTLDEDKKGLLPHTTRVDIGDGFQTSLSNFLHKELNAESPICKAFDVAIRERGVADKLYIGDPGQVDRTDSESRLVSDDKTISFEDAIRQIDKEREQSADRETVQSKEPNRGSDRR